VKRQVGRVELTGDPEGAEVLMNGKVVGKLPLPQPVRVSAGSVDLELRAPGYKPGFRTITLTGGQYQVVVMRLERESEPPAASSTAAADGAAAPPPGVHAARGSGGQRWRPWVTWGALGGAVVAAGVGAYAINEHNGDVKGFNKLGCRELGSGAVSTTNPADNGLCAQRRADYKNDRTMAIVGFSAAGALAAAGLLLYLTTPDEGAGRERARASRPACAPALAGGARGVACALAF
jgi:hypothetical protein